MPEINPASCSSAPVWDQALDWLMQVQAAPGDDGIRRRRDVWLAAHESHAKAYLRAERVWRLTGRVTPVFPIDESTVTAPVRCPPARRTGGRVWGAAAALAACLTGMLLPGLEMRLRSDVQTATGEIRQVTLADGSSVTLDSESALGLAFSAQRRDVSLLSGRAFFQVAAESARPFVVTVGEVTVSVTGTAFDVLSTDSEIVVDVQSGTVAVTAVHQGRPVRTGLDRGGRVRVARADGAVVRDSVSPQQVGLWRSGRLVVNGATIAEVIEELGRHYQGIIVVRDKTLAARKVTGVFDLGNPLAAVDAVLQPHGGVARQWTPYLVVVSTR